MVERRLVVFIQALTFMACSVRNNLENAADVKGELVMLASLDDIRH